jgi:hypothetical protein
LRRAAKSFAARERAVFSTRDSDKKGRKGFFARHFGAKGVPSMASEAAPLEEDVRPGATTGPDAGDIPAEEDGPRYPQFSPRDRETVPFLEPGRLDYTPPHRAAATPEPAAEPSQAGEESTPPASDEDALDGLTLEAYCAAHSLTTAEVWRRLRSGELTGRTEKGRLLIYARPAAVADGPLDFRPSPEAGGLPPLPGSDQTPAGDTAATAKPHAAAGGFLALSGDRSSTPELALLLDHLSLAKEENREILRLTQDSIRKVTELSESIVEMKDAMIEAKEEQIQLLRSQLDNQTRQLSQLKQQNEDLEMLARTLTKDS